MKIKTLVIGTAMSAMTIIATAQPLTIDLTQKGVNVSPSMYGIFFEEINHAGDGGLYAELLQNRGFEEQMLPSGLIYRDGNAYAPALPNYYSGEQSLWHSQWNIKEKEMTGWRVEGTTNYGVVLMNEPLHMNTPHAMRLALNGQGTLINTGYWGVAVRKGEKYDLRLYVRGEDFDKQDVLQTTVSLYNPLSQQSVGDITYQIPLSVHGWQEITATVTATETMDKGELRLNFTGNGTFVEIPSGFPQTAERFAVSSPSGLSTNKRFAKCKSLRKSLSRYMWTMYHFSLRIHTKDVKTECVVTWQKCSKDFTQSSCAGPAAVS